MINGIKQAVYCAIINLPFAMSYSLETSADVNVTGVTAEKWVSWNFANIIYEKPQEINHSPFGPMQLFLGFCPE